MKNLTKAPLSSYIAVPLITILFFTLASLFFSFILKKTDPVPVFIIFGTIQLICMILFAILPKRGKQVARMVSMYFIGLFIFVLAGVLGRNNFQLDGFFFYLTTGTLSGVLVHFMMAKIIGPLFYGRNWCSWGCWTAMVLDLLPYKTNTSWKKNGLPGLRYIHFVFVLFLTITIYFVFKKTIVHTDPAALKTGMGTITELIWFLTGNGIYYLVGIVLAFKLKDNRAFCKYICPLTVFLKAMSRFSLLRIAGNKITCTNCKTCIDNCPMSIDIPAYISKEQRVKSTECIMCMKCIANCPNAVLKASVGIDIATKEHLH
jgi:polyferredoxin